MSQINSRMRGPTRAAAIATVALAILASGGCGDEENDADPHDSGPGHSAAKGVDGHAHAAGDAHDAKEGADPHGHGHGHAGHADEVKLTADAMRRSDIRLATVKPQTLTTTIVAPARVAYNAEAVAHVGSLVTGRIAALPVRVGDTVNEGDVLAVIDSAELGAAQGDYLQRRTAVETARPAVDLAQAASERLQKLYEQTQGTTLTEVETRKREYAAARGDLAAAEAALRAAANRLQLLGMDEAAVAALGQSGKINPAYAIKSPIGGRVVEREVTRGELVGPDKPRLMMLADLGTVWVLADVPEAELGQITDAAAAHVTVTATGGDPLEGKVAHVAAELDPATRTGRVRIEVSNPDLRLRPGMFGRVEIAAGAAGNEPVLAVPEEAIQTVEGDASVFVPVSGEPNTFAKRAVGIGPAVGGMVPVFAGLKEGEQYVVRGAFTLKAELGKGGAAHDH